MKLSTSLENLKNYTKKNLTKLFIFLIKCKNYKFIENLI